MKEINEKETPLVIGCNYHTKRQSHPAMRFVLDEVLWETVILKTRTTNKTIKCNKNDLIFIKSKHNIEKAQKVTWWDEYESKYRLKKTVVWADVNTIFTYKYINHKNIKLTLIEWESLWYLLDLIQAVSISDTRFFEKIY